jgi:hypothetical protein
VKKRGREIYIERVKGKKEGEKYREREIIWREKVESRKRGIEINTKRQKEETKV